MDLSEPAELLNEPAELLGEIICSWLLSSAVISSMVSQIVLIHPFVGRRKWICSVQSCIF
jgi:hypothetical protein